MLQWLRNFFFSAQQRMQKAYQGPYRAFTKEFDREVCFHDAPSAATFKMHNPAFPDYDLDACLEDWVPKYEPSALELVSVLGASDLRNTAVTLLVDHSGSLRGEKCCLVAAIVGVASECLARLGVRHEILGFTTRSWHGGQSRNKWENAGQPAAPGRLCDLLHIVYRRFDDVEPIEHDGLKLMTDPRILKENVDGEAVLWAYQRLLAPQASRRILLVISDGAPVDDSTLLRNGPNILDDHLKLVTRDIVQNCSIELYGVGIHYQMFRYYPQYVVIGGADDIGKTFIPALGAILMSSTHAPHIDQLPRSPS
ncbi:MAG: hypothetical protein JNM59_13535 [Hyphomonadaceae bacterium]|nr:hypothetical protein [Hyphomonadaceae bacterium]